MSASQPAVFNVQQFSDAGAPLVNGRLYTYAQGTTTHKTAYTDAAELVPHTYTSDGIGGQYIALDSRGELVAPLYLSSGAYDLTLKRADGSTVWTRMAGGIENVLSALRAEISAPDGASMVGYKTTTLDLILKNSLGKVVSSVAGMKAIDKTAATHAYVTGYYAAGDGGGGAYYYDAADTSSADNGGTIIVADDGGRWKLARQSYLSARQFGAKGDGTTDDTAAITAAMTYLKTVNGGKLYFPRGSYPISTGFAVNSTTFGGSFPAEACLFWEGDGPTSSAIIWTNGGFGKTGTLLDWGTGVYGGVRGLQFITNANNGHTSQTIDGFVTSSTGLAGCDSTSSVAIKHAYNGSFVIEQCDFQRWHRAVWMDLGYNRAIKDCSFMFNNVGIGTYGAATINEYTNCRVERNAIGLSFALASAMKIDNVVSEANYAGCDVFITGPVHSLKFRRCYFEASPQQVVILGAGSAEIGLNAPSGLFFDECNSISIAVPSGSVGDVYLTRSIVGTAPITAAGAGKFIVKDNWQHTGAGAAMVRRRASGYAVSGAGKLLIKDRSEDDAWVTFSAAGGTITVLDGFNMSVVRTATGRYTFTFTYPMDHANYALTANVAGSASDVGSASFASAGGVTSSTTQCSISTWTYSGAATDPNRITVRVSGGQLVNPY